MNMYIVYQHSMSMSNTKLHEIQRMRGVVLTIYFSSNSILVKIQRAITPRKNFPVNMHIYLYQSCVRIYVSRSKDLTLIRLHLHSLSLSTRKFYEILKCNFRGVVLTKLMDGSKHYTRCNSLHGVS